MPDLKWMLWHDYFSVLSQGWTKLTRASYHLWTLVAPLLLHRWARYTHNKELCNFVHFPPWKLQWGQEKQNHNGLKPIVWRVGQPLNLLIFLGSDGARTEPLEHLGIDKDPWWRRLCLGAPCNLLYHFLYMGCDPLYSSAADTHIFPPINMHEFLRSY